VTKAEFSTAEKRVVSEMQRIAQENPLTTTPSLAFKRDWAYGQCSLENEKITREDVDRIIQK
jgi:hypothetical protein